MYGLSAGFQVATRPALSYYSDNTTVAKDNRVAAVSAELTNPRESPILKDNFS